jgi:hypothetical protein
MQRGFESHPSSHLKTGNKMSQNYKETLKELNLPGSDWVALTYSDGADVMHYKDDAVNDAVSETDVVSRFSDLIMSLPELRRNGILEDLADAVGLELPDPEDSDAEPIDASIISEAIENNFFDQQFIDYSMKQYDHKRGYCTLTATVEVTVDELLSSDLDLFRWTIELQTKHGKLTLGA